MSTLCCLEKEEEKKEEEGKKEGERMRRKRRYSLDIQKMAVGGYSWVNIELGTGFYELNAIRN